MLPGKDVHELEEMKQMGLSVLAISEVTGYDRKTVRKYLFEPEALPSYGPRVSPPGKLARVDYLPSPRSPAKRVLRTLYPCGGFQIGRQIQYVDRSVL